MRRCGEWSGRSVVAVYCGFCYGAQRKAFDGAYAAALTLRHLGASFWLAVRDPFIRHDLTREDVREVMRRGLVRTGGSYRLLAELFNLAPADYDGFLTFLWKYDCHVPFRHSA